LRRGGQGVRCILNSEISYQPTSNSLLLSIDLFGTWNLELGTWILDLGIYLELGTWNLELGTWILDLHKVIIVIFV